MDPCCDLRSSLASKAALGSLVAHLVGRNSALEKSVRDQDGEPEARYAASIYYIIA